MDTSFWTQLNPTVKCIETKKKFFNQYLYKAVVHTPGCRIINDNKILYKGVEHLLNQRINLLESTANYRIGSWSSSYTQRRVEYLKVHARIDQLEYWISIRNALKGSIKLRLEEPNLSVYCNDQELLYCLLVKNYPERVEEIHSPANEKSIEILNRGEIIFKSYPEFQYKIMLRENKIKDVETKRTLLDYLYNLGDDEVCLTKSLVKHLGSNHMWFPGGYFYAKDEKIVTFINLIAPECIAGIYKLSNPDL